MRLYHFPFYFYYSSTTDSLSHLLLLLLWVGGGGGDLIETQGSTLCLCMYVWLRNRAVVGLYRVIVRRVLGGALQLHNPTESL